MKQFNVKWNGYENQANSPLEGAKDALDAIINGDAKVFLLQDQETGKCYSVDLCEDDEDAVLEITTEEFEKDEYSVSPKQKINK